MIIAEVVGECVCVCESVSLLLLLLMEPSSLLEFPETTNEIFAETKFLSYIIPVVVSLSISPFTLYYSTAPHYC